MENIYVECIQIAAQSYTFGKYEKDIKRDGV